MVDGYDVPDLRSQMEALGIPFDGALGVRRRTRETPKLYPSEAEVRHGLDFYRQELLRSDLPMELRMDYESQVRRILSTNNINDNTRVVQQYAADFFNSYFQSRGLPELLG